jgi:NAD(P)-dependent dehydrogenase (short-subunit alcohol dehydrogenase family)
MSKQESEVPTPLLPAFTKAWHTKSYPSISPTRPELSASGRNIVITGGGTGIGKAVAIAFAQAGAASVSIVGRRLDRLQDTASEIAVCNPSTKVIAQTGDITERTSLDRAFAFVRDQVGEIDVFVPCAGTLNAIAPLSGYNQDEFQRGLNLNVMGAFNALQAFLTVATPDAMVFNISSMFAHLPPSGKAFAYSVNKIAIYKMYDYLQAENPDLHVVSIQPGIIATEINSAYEVDCPDDGALPFAST